VTHPVDVRIGAKIRQRRLLNGMTMEELGERVGVRLQQIQKYETAQNRISVSRLWTIAHALDVPISYFFDEEEDRERYDLTRERDASALVRVYQRIPESQRRQFVSLARTLGSA